MNANTLFWLHHKYIDTIWITDSNWINFFPEIYKLQDLEENKNNSTPEHFSFIFHNLYHTFIETNMFLSTKLVTSFKMDAFWVKLNKSAVP